MSNPTLTVIVPCYNVSLYLKKCVDSILNQYYKDLDIILIDDGSTDETPSICDCLAQKDKRIRVFHQKNKGSSKCREIGIKSSKGDFITFVDADDWIHSEMYSIMMSALIESSADIVQCGVCDAFIQNQQIIYKHRYTDVISPEFEVYDKREGVLKVLDDCEWHSYMWNKIYRKNILSNIKFPLRGLDEDLSIMHQIFHNASSSIYIKSELYYYLHRSGSICSANDKKSITKKIIDRNNARWERYQFTLQHSEYHNMLNKMQNIVVSVGLQSLRYIQKNKDSFDKSFVTGLKKKLLSLSNIQLMTEYFSRIKKVEWFLFRKMPTIYYISIKLIGK